VTDPTRGVPEPGRGRARILASLLLPLFFVVLFPLMFVSATHAPTPHELPLLLGGPDQVVQQIADGLDADDRFQVTQTDVPGEAQRAVEARQVDGAVDVVLTADASGSTSTAVTTYVAQAAGRAVASTVQAAGDGIASQLGVAATVVDVAPLSAEDPLGIDLFYLLTFTTLGAYLVIIVLMQVMPQASLRTRFLAVTITAVAAPLIVFGLSSMFVGDYGVGFGTIAALLGVNALYVFTIGTAAILIEQLLGVSATFGVMAFIVFLNIPSAGGATPSALLPPFWQAVHSVYIGSGAFESFRSIVYFGGDGASRWLLQLLAWTVGLILVNLVVHLASTVRSQRRTIQALADQSGTGAGDALDAPTHPRPSAPKHVGVESLTYDHGAPTTPDRDPQRSISAGREGAHA